MVVQAYEYETKCLQNKPEHVKPFQDLVQEKEEDNNHQSEEEERRRLPTAEEQPLRQFFQTTRSSFKTPLFRRLDLELRQRRKEMLRSKGWEVTKTKHQNYTTDDDNDNKKNNKSD